MITKELKFSNFQCSINCSYCSAVCLIAKDELKMIGLSSCLKLNEIHLIDSPFNEDPKNIIFSREALILGRNGRKIYGKWESEDGQFRKRISPLTHWYQTPCDASMFLHARPILGKK